MKIRFGNAAAGTALSILCAACGGGDGPAIEARAQTIEFAGAAPSLNLSGTASVAATASSGLPVRYGSATPAVCTVDADTGVVTDIALGTCKIVADQSGNTRFAPAPQVTQSIAVGVNPSQSIRFGAAPALSALSTTTVSASASSGLPVSYSSLTPAICSVDGSTGLVTDIAAGACIIAASQAGDANFHAAPQATQTLTVSVLPGITVPGAPTGVAATIGDTANTVLLSIGATNSGGSPITGYSVTSRPAGIVATGATSPLTVTCPSTCAGYAFSVLASNGIGNGAPSAAVDVLTNYNIVDTFFEPDTQPRNSIFIGSFTLNSTTGTVSQLQGILSESMTGSQTAYPADNMTWLSLTHQLSAVSDGAGGMLISTFMLNSTDTFTRGAAYGGTDGWTPGSGNGLYDGFPASKSPAAGGVGNAYVRIYVNPANPTAALTPSQIDKLAYADCSAGGMMGATCMTGTTLAGYGSIGTMSGYPVSQTITKKP